METISSKISLYDFLTILTAGFLLLFLCLGKIPKGEEWLFASVASYLIGLLFHLVVEFTLGKFIRNHSYILRKAHKEVEQSLNQVPMPDAEYNTYLEAYYLVVKNNCLMNIPILEAQVAFVRNIWVILLFYIVTICSCCPTLQIVRDIFGPSCNIAVGMTALWLILPFVWYRLQMRICKLVWEGGYFINKNK